MKIATLLLVSAWVTCSTAARAQNVIHAYAVGNWRNGPTVVISPLFETTEQATTPQLIAQVRAEWPGSFTDTTDIDIQRFATTEEGEESRTTLKAKYGVRKLDVRMLEGSPTPDSAPEKREHRE